MPDTRPVRSVAVYFDDAEWIKGVAAQAAVSSTDVVHAMVQTLKAQGAMSFEVKSVQFDLKNVKPLPPAPRRAKKPKNPKKT